jgi:8-oxo-dGTP pyrophosphatase MutT (NUDIX family)
MQIRDEKDQFKPEQLIKALQQELPGLKAQLKMLPGNRPPLPFHKPENAKESAVLILLYQSENIIKVCFIKRPADGTVHAGQISLPGGKMEKSDKDLIVTALRETSEEIGVDVHHIRILGTLTNLYVPVSNYSIQPVIGFSLSKPDFVINNSEVDELIEVPLKQLLDSENCKTGQVEAGKAIFEAPIYAINGHKIWGATAMILSEFIEVYKKLDVKMA